VLVPSLTVIGFAKVHTAENAANARKLLYRFPRIGIIVVNETLPKSNDKRAIYIIANVKSIPVVLLTDRDVILAKEGDHVDKVVNKRTATILETER
jgi:hypothetical protein